MVFEEKFIPEEEIVSQALRNTHEFIEANSIKESTRSHHPPTTQPCMQHSNRKWRKPDPTFLKANRNAN